MAANATATLTVKLRDLVSGPSKGIKSAFRGIRKSFEGVGRTFELAGKVGFAATAVNQLGQQARGALTSVLAPALRFEDTMARVGALTTGLTEEQFAELNSMAREIGRTTRFMAQEAGEGFGQLAIAGFDAEQQMAALPPILKLTQASGMDMGRVADITSDLMGAFGKEASDTGEIAGVLAATFSNSTTTLETLFETLKYGAPIATAAGIEMQQTATLVGLLGNAGIKGSQAGTALVGMLRRLTAPSRQARKALNELGITSEDIAENLDKPAVLLKKISDAFADKDFVPAEKLAILTKVFGRSATAAEVLLANANKVGEDGKTAFERLVAAVNDGENALDKMSKIMDETGLSAVRRLSSAVESLKLDIAEKLGPTLMPLIANVTQLVGKLAEWAARNPALVATIGKVLIGITVFSTVVSPLLLTVSSLISAWSMFRLALVLGSSPMRITAGLLGSLKNVLSRSIDKVVAMAGASTKMATSLKLVSGAVGLVGAAFAGWQVGKYLDEAIGKALNLRGQLLSTEMGLQAAESSWVNDYLQSFGEFYGVNSLAEAAKKNREINREREQAGGVTEQRGFLPVAEPAKKKESEEDRKLKVEIDVKGEARVRKVKAGKAVEANVGSNVSPF